ncbi:hypothetical protein OGAPHI_005152 [Ogataea philodendri]|uniref:Uncharacterized protein n=1 Tax=Ogataea philodendri TaxID=1378263 RepID=A0A9P8P1U8_9ASCO|nr:uncharacterized protein OGAPHI_005152 [Ogataea philodendri]KAH3663750.1 hypothetical protein OGAPHI_005152 [Ogataea philodendri]
MAAAPLEEEEEPAEVDSSEAVAEPEPEEEESAVLEWLTEDEDSVAAEQTNLSPWIPPFLDKDSNSSQSTLPVVSRSKPPLTVDRDGKVALSKSPFKITAPPMDLSSSKPSMPANLELLTTTKPPPREVKLEKSTEVNSSLFSMERSPPILVTPEKSRSSTLDSKIPIEELTVVMFGKLIDETELDLGVDGTQVLVVVDVEALNNQWVQTVQGLQLGVRNVDTLTVGNTVQTRGGQGWESDPVDGSNRVKRSKRKSVQDGELGELQLFGNGSKGVCGKGGQRGGVEDGQRTVDGLDVGDGGSSQVTGDENVTLDSRTGGKIIQVGLHGGSEGLGERTSRSDRNGGCRSECRVWGVSIAWKSRGLG